MTHIRAKNDAHPGSEANHDPVPERYTRSCINAILDRGAVVSPVDIYPASRVRMGKGKDKQQRKRRTVDELARDGANERAASEQQSRSARQAFAKSGFAVPSSSGKTAVESTTVESVKSKPAVAPATPSRTPWPLSWPLRPRQQLHH